MLFRSVSQSRYEGELTVNHITAPLEIQQTYESFEWGKQTNCEIDTTNAESCMDAPVKSPVYGDILEGCTIGYNRDDYIAYGVCSDGAECQVLIPRHTLYIESILAPNSVQVHPHFHNFPNLPLKLMGKTTDIISTTNGITTEGSLDANSAVRAIGANNNHIAPVQPLPVKNSDTQFTVVEKFGGVCEPIVISEGSWTTQNISDELPAVNGARSSLYTAEQVNSLISQLDAKWEKQYNELKSKLDNIS